MNCPTCLTAMARICTQAGICDHWHCEQCGTMTAQYPDMVSSILPAATAKLVFSIAAFISGAITFYNTKQKDVHGGTISTGTIPSVANTQQAVAVVQAKAIADGTPIPNTPVVPLPPTTPSKP